MAIDAVFESWNNPQGPSLTESLTKLMTVGVQLSMYKPWFTETEETPQALELLLQETHLQEKKKFFGEYLINAQGEDVVAGIRTPDFIDTLGNKIPEAYKQLVDICQKLEAHFRDMQDIEFTIQEGKLYMLQTRTGKRTAALP